jgi:hypothetical protein
MSKLTKIEIWWEGPYTKEEVKAKSKGGSSYGLYQIYGTHNISGPNTLLYIGKADRQNFFKRIKQHNWIDWESSTADIYIGRLGGVKQVDDDEWGGQIDKAERLLIYFCAPPYNSSGLKKYGTIKDTVVLNFNKKNRLPLEVSTF